MIATRCTSASVSLVDHDWEIISVRCKTYYTSINLTASYFKSVKFSNNLIDMFLYFEQDSIRF